MLLQQWFREKINISLNGCESEKYGTECLFKMFSDRGLNFDELQTLMRSRK